MVHEITLSDPLEKQMPPEKVLVLKSVGDSLFVSIETFDEDNRSTNRTVVADSCVSLPAIREALELMRNGEERERLREPGEPLLSGPRMGAYPL